MTPNPQEDGVTHLNVYSQGQTSLGRFLSNFYNWIIETEDGVFDSIEGYWYWLGCEHPDRDQLRTVSGAKAKKLGRELRGKDWQSDDEFKRKICAAISLKIKSHPAKWKELRDNTLPLAHYYVFGGKVVEPSDGAWILEHIQSVAKEQS